MKPLLVCYELQGGQEKGGSVGHGNQEGQHYAQAKATMSRANITQAR